MAGQSQDQFEFYFRRADLDGDGRISGAEAVSFLNGSGLPKQVLAQVWMHADQSRSGFLSRQEFYNALKLVTVAQSKRELTPEIVKAALYGHAAAKIPPPKINLPPTTAPQMGGVAPAASPNPGLRGPVAPSFAMGQQYTATQQSQSIRPVQAVPAVAAPLPTQGNTAFSGQPQVMPAATAAHPPQSMPSVATGSNLSNPNVSTDWLGGRTGGAPIGPQGVAPATSLPVTNPQASFAMPSQTTISNSKALVAPGDALSSNSGFGGEAFSVIPSTQKQEPSMAAYSASSMLASSAIIPTPSTVQPVAKSNALDSLQSSFSMQSTGRMQSPLNPSQHISTQSSSLIASSGISAGVVNSASTTTQLPWPKMKPSDIQKYTKVFVEVDTDRDGKITGEQARNLFLSWRLPREVLKQVWDLSDQDNDSMLSLREFCFALYLMERFREGRPLPAALPNNIMFDETLLTMTGQPTGAYGNPAWGPNSGFGQQQGMAARAMTPSAGFRPPVPPRASHADSTTVMSHQSKAGTPVSDDRFASQLSNGEPNSLDSNAQDASADGKKVDGTEKVILDSKEKIEFYRTKMQELVMYKSRCENRLNEITERAIADKREAEILTKKYEEKYKQVAEIASKLTIEEAKFREIQERKTELHQAIVNVEQGGSADGILQVRADRIQSDLEELMKALAERYKKHGHDIKSSAVIELPIGWHPGVPEGAALWDEEWDKFEDEGFGNELTVDVKKTSPASTQREEALPDGSLTPDSLSSEKHGSLFTANERALEVESAYTHSEDGTRSPRGSPGGRTSLESPTQQFSDGPFVKSPKTDTETHRSFDESAWGAFDNDDTDSVWGFNSKAMDSERHTDSFGWSNFGANSTRTESPSAESVFNRKSPFVFEDSVPSTSLSRFGNSSPRFSDVSRDQFDSFSRFDSFSMHDGGFSQPERLTRFDSVNSSKDFGHGFSFDDSDPFGSSGPFKVSSDNHSPKKGSDKWSSF